MEELENAMQGIDSKNSGSSRVSKVNVMSFANDDTEDAISALKGSSCLPRMASIGGCCNFVDYELAVSVVCDVIDAAIAEIEKALND